MIKIIEIEIATLIFTENNYEHSETDCEIGVGS